MEALGTLDIGEESNVEWRIPNFVSLSVEDGKCYDSPSFLFNDQSWCLRTYPNGFTEGHSVGYVSLFLRSKTHGSNSNLDFLLGLKNSDGKKEEEMEYTCNFNVADKGFGSSCFISRTKLLQRQSELLPGDSLIVVCTLKNQRLIGITNEAVNSNNSIMQYKYKALQDYKEIYLKQEDCDVIIKVKEREFPAHRLILKARSPVLASALRSDMKENATGIIDIEDCDPLHFSDFLYFIYCGEVNNLTVENAFELFTVSDKYDVSDLRALCLNFIKHNLSIDTFCNTVTLALMHCEAELLELCTEFFSKNFKKIIVTVQWQNFLVENPIQSNEIFIKALASDHPETS